jgi:capsular polysaccharide biosynthesis protein
MALREYVRIIVQRGWIVTFLALLAAGAAYLISERQAPLYETGVNISVRPVRPDLDLGQSVEAMLRSLAGDITTHSFLGQAIERAQLEGITTDELLSGKRLLVEAEPADYTIAITVRNADADMAVRAANAIAELFAAQRQEWNERQVKDNQVAVEIRDYARQAGIYSPRPKLYAAAGGFLGAMLGAGIAAVLEWLRAASVNSAQDLAYMDVPILGAIPPRSRQRQLGPQVLKWIRPPPS